MQHFSSASLKSGRPLQTRTKNVSSAWRLREATQSERTQWDTLIINNPDGGSFLQSTQFMDFKQRGQWKARYFVYETGNRHIAAAAFSCYIFPLGELWYFPKGPGVGGQDDLALLAKATRRFIKENNQNVFLVKIEPEVPYRVSKTRLHQVGLLQAQPIQPSTSTVIVPLVGIEYEILNRFNKKARYSIRLGMCENIEVREVEHNERNSQHMYALMKTVAGGRGVPGIRPYTYYRDFWNTFINAGAGRLYFAYENGKPVVGAFVILTGSKAVYKDGGSDPGRRSKGASYLLQWHIMTEMRHSGATTYDMWGTSPKALLHATTHPLHGVSFFKTRFSKEVIDYCGVLDLVLSPTKYLIWQKWIYPVVRRCYRLFCSYFY